MKKNVLKAIFAQKRGFTLIELLVVVLIVGILAAVAVPQYQKTVYKSRYNAMKPLVKALADAEEVYYLANEKYTGNVEELDVDWPEIPNEITSNKSGDNGYFFNWGYCSLNANISPRRVLCKNTQIGMTYGRLLLHQPDYPTYAGMQRCDAQDEIGEKICQQQSGLSTYNPPEAAPGYNTYNW